MVHREVRCIYRLDLGQEHHNPSCVMVGETHKHRWTEQQRDKEAYRPYGGNSAPRLASFTTEAFQPYRRYRRSSSDVFSL
jgi:hypothetical protein